METKRSPRPGPRTISRLGNAVLMLVFAAFLAACSGLLESDQPSRQNYLLQPITSAGAAAAESAGPLTLLVSAVPGLDTDRIQGLDSHSALTPYANARWPDHLPEVVGSVMQRSLEYQGLFSPVSQARLKPAKGNWLSIELRRFFGLIDSTGNTGSVSIYFAASWQCGDTAGEATLKADKPVSTDRLSAIVSAHQSALDDASRQLMSQLAESCG